MGKWLLLVYRLPSEPSAPRVSAWRALRRLEGRYLQDGVFSTTMTPGNDAVVRAIAQDVRNAGGEAIVLDVHAADVEAMLRPLPIDETKTKLRKRR